MAMIDLKHQKILVTGAHGFLGKHIIKNLTEKRGVPKTHLALPRSNELDLRVWEHCERAVSGRDIVINLAAKVGGIGYNQKNPGELFYDNIIIGGQLLEAARRAGVRKFVALGTICSYPKFTPAPFREEELWNGYPEETNAPYGLAKKAILVQAQAYRAQYGFNAIYLLPVNLYGPGDSFEEEKSHVIAALIKKIADAKQAGRQYIEAWGTGTATREFLYVEDAAEAIISALERYEKHHPVNVGSGTEISISDLAKLIARLMDFKGEIRWDRSKPDGQPRRQLDTTRAKEEFGFSAKTSLEEGLRKTIDWYVSHGAR